MTDHDCNELEQDGVGDRALLEQAVKRIEEKDALIRQLQHTLDNHVCEPSVTYAYPVALVVMDEIPEGFYEGQVVDETLDPDDYEARQAEYLEDERQLNEDLFIRDSWGFDPYGYGE